MAFCTSKIACVKLLVHKTSKICLVECYFTKEIISKMKVAAANIMQFYRYKNYKVAFYRCKIALIGQTFSVCGNMLPTAPVTQRFPSLYTHVIRRDEPRHFCTRRQLSVDQTLNFALRPTIVNINNGQHVPLKQTTISDEKALLLISSVRFTFLGWNSYLTQCWKPLPLIFIDVKTRQLPTK